MFRSPGQVRDLRKDRRDSNLAIPERRDFILAIPDRRDRNLAIEHRWTIQTTVGTGATLGNGATRATESFQFQTGATENKPPRHARLNTTQTYFS